MSTVTELATMYDSRASFYGKATVEKNNQGDELLRPYGTPVALFVATSNPAIVLGSSWDASQTTMRHVVEFFKQHGMIEPDGRVANIRGLVADENNSAVTTLDGDTELRLPVDEKPAVAPTTRSPVSEMDLRAMRSMVREIWEQLDEHPAEKTAASLYDFLTDLISTNEAPVESSLQRHDLGGPDEQLNQGLSR